MVISSILKVESTSSYSRWINVSISTWICLLYSMKHWQTFSAEFWFRVNGESTKLCPLDRRVARYVFVKTRCRFIVYDSIKVMGTPSPSNCRTEQFYLILFIRYASYCSCYYNICIMLDGFCCVSEKNNASLVIIYITVIKMNVLQIA